MSGPEVTAEELTFQEVAQLNDRKAELKSSYSKYIKNHPEIKSMLNDFMCAVLLEKPEDIFDFAESHFASLAPSKRAADTGEEVAPMVLTGPTGVGKKAIAKSLATLTEEHCSLPLWHFAREPQTAIGEADGITGYYTTEEALTADIENGKMVEYQRGIDGVLSGLSYAAVSEISARGTVPLICVGVDTFKNLANIGAFPTAHTVFIRPHEVEAIEERLKERGTNTTDQITDALARSEDEIRFAKEFPFDRIIVNAVVDAAVADLKEGVVEWYPKFQRFFQRANPASS
uniref:Guanylate kinase-like domain-containing protein n=1 Tax=Rhizochromulina marina TaxID=1034831 RepID=A0A7S2SAF1_9STRA|mmetsp:Transcript_26696/g.77694  ORF Transcript_26696/g.77694 Transcript_26696/m.77694 type:complete len:288 (+) Transcript_26696:92-955(+)